MEAPPPGRPPRRSGGLARVGVAGVDRLAAWAPWSTEELAGTVRAGNPSKDALNLHRGWVRLGTAEAPISFPPGVGWPLRPGLSGRPRTATVDAPSIDTRTGRPRRCQPSTAASVVLLLSAAGLATMAAGCSSSEGSTLGYLPVVPRALGQDLFERIDRYAVDIAIERSGDLLITEVIGYDFGVQERHGIFRDVPVRLRYDDTYDRIFPLDVVSVSASSGTPAEYVVEDADGQTRIRIGDPDITITGRHEYVIVYRVEAALNGFAEHDELYWNAVGTEWDVLIRDARSGSPRPPRHRVAASPDGGSSLACDHAELVDGEAVFTRR